MLPAQGRRFGGPRAAAVSASGRRPGGADWPPGLWPSCWRRRGGSAWVGCWPSARSTMSPP
jgi:hypothetical protein